MLTSDLDVLYATLYLLLRSAQQYGHAVPFDRNLGRKLTSRLVTLAKGFDKLRSATTTMQDLTSDSLTVSEDVFHLTTSFYPAQSGTNSLQTPSKATARVAADTSVSLILGDVREIGMKGLNGKVAAMATSQFVPVEDQFDAVNKARWLLSFSDIAVRKDLLAVRLMAIAVYGM
jgi:E3 ubiquitin-protein ligase HUWE1